jgi:hypothetical protein
MIVLMYHRHKLLDLIENIWHTINVFAINKHSLEIPAKGKE